MVQSEVYVYNFVKASTFLTSLNRNGKKLVSLSESKIDHTGSNTTSNYYADESVQRSLLSIYWQSYQNTLALVWNLPGWHHIPLLQSTLVVFLMFQSEAKEEEWVKGLYMRVTKARYLGLTRQKQLWLYANYFGHLIKTHEGVLQLFYAFSPLKMDLSVFILSQARICTACSTSLLLAHILGLLYIKWQGEYPHGIFNFILL